MAARNSDSNAGTNGDGAKASARGRPSPDAVARALSEVEKTLERLKQVRAERAEAEKRFKAEIAAREERITELEGTVADLTEAEQSRQRESEDVLEKLEQFEARIGELEAELDTERTTRELVEGKLGEASQSADEQAEQFRNQLAEAEDRERELAEARDREHQESETRLGELREQLERATGNADAQAAELRGQVDALERRAAELEADLGEKHQRAEELTSQLGVSDARVAELEAALQDKESDAQEAGQNASILSDKVGEQEAELEQLRARLAEVEASIGERDAQLGESQHAIEERDSQLAEARAAIEQREAQLAEAQATIAERDNQLAQAEGTAGEQVQRLASELEAARQELAEYQQQSASEIEAAQASRAELEAALEQRDGELTEARNRSEALEQALREQSSSDEETTAALEALSQEAEDRVASVRAELESALESERGQVRELSEKLDLAADQLMELQRAVEDRDRALSEAGGGDEAVARLTAEVEELRSRLADAEQRADQAATAVGDGGGSTVNWAEDRVALRRARLRRCRELIRDQRQQASKGEQILEQRLKQCDDLLARRRELVEARQIIEKTHKKVVSGRAKSGAAAAIFFGLAIVTVLSGLSWAVVTRVFPATYAASAVVAADFEGQAPRPGDLEGWQKFHEELLSDPNLMTRVSERMAQRGFESLSQPAAVKAMLDADMTVTSPQDGKLAIELRGLGRDATVRKLDTLVTTFAVEANALRQRRTEPSTTVVAERARPGVEPIEDPRLQYAGIGVGAGTAFAFVLWFGIWRRMVKTKHAFEHETEIEGLLEESAWVDPIQKIIDARPEGPAEKPKAA